MRVVQSHNNEGCKNLASLASAPPICKVDTFYSHVIKYEHQIHKYHQKERLLESKMMLQYTKNSLIIEEIRSSAMYFPIGAFLTISFISHDVFAGFTASLFLSDWTNHLQLTSVFHFRVKLPHMNV